MTWLRIAFAIYLVITGIHWLWRAPALAARSPRGMSARAFRALGVASLLVAALGVASAVLE